MRISLSSDLQEDLHDTSHYVRSELLALDREQRQIDERAAEVELELRNFMDSGELFIFYPLN